MKRFKPKSKWHAALFAAPLTLAAGLLVAAAPSSGTNTSSVAGTLAPANPMTVTPIVSTEAIGIANSLSEAFRNVASTVTPAVVSIENRPDRSWQRSQNPTRPNDDSLG